MLQLPDARQSRNMFIEHLNEPRLDCGHPNDRSDDASQQSFRSHNFKFEQKVLRKSNSVKFSKSQISEDRQKTNYEKKERIFQNS